MPLNLVIRRAEAEAHGERLVTPSTLKNATSEELKAFVERLEALTLPDHTKHVDAALSALLKHGPDEPMPYSFGYSELWEWADKSPFDWRSDAENDVEPVITFRDISDFVKSEGKKPSRQFVLGDDGKPDATNPVYTLAEVYKWIENQRNLPSSYEAATEPPIERASALTIYTGQETDTYFRGVANGKRGHNYTNDEQLSLCFYQTPGEPHRLQLDADADDPEYNFMGLQSLVGEQDTDAAFAACYVLTLLAPAYPFQTGQRSGPVWIDLDDVAEKIGLAPDKCSTAEREAVRQRIRRYIKFGARARIVGKRSIPYYEKRAGREKNVISTDILHALWNVEAEQVPSNVADGITPRRMQLTATAAIVPLLSSPDLAQFMHGGERIAAIPGGRPVGAWARSIGLVLMMEWRKHMLQAVDGTLLLTRRGLLETYPPKTAAAAEILNSENPKRAREYWRLALSELATQGIVERQGEAEWQSDEVEAKDRHENKGKDGIDLPRKGWQVAWLDTPVLLHPGPFYRANLQMLLANKFHAPPRNLTKSVTRKPGRPRKTAQAATA